MKVLIVSEQASVRFGGEAVLPWHYFNFLRQRGVDAYLMVNEFTKPELLSLRPQDEDRMFFTPPNIGHKLSEKCSFLPNRINYFTFGLLVRMLTERKMRSWARQLVRDEGFTVIHQPSPVSPRMPSRFFNMGVPVVIGPMNGNMSYPESMRAKYENPHLTFLRHCGYAVMQGLNYLIPGKLRAGLLLVSNQRTKDGLPNGSHARVEMLVENGVDLSLWNKSTRVPNLERSARFVFMGRLVDWKATEVLLYALAKVKTEMLPELEILGDGDQMPMLKALADELGIADRVVFRGWKSQDECAKILHNADALVLSSVYECGGAVVLEAMAMGLPVIASDWGGPADYLNNECGILVAPESMESFIDGFAKGVQQLAESPELRQEMGEAGRKRIEDCFDWQLKIDQILKYYEEVGG